MDDVAKLPDHDRAAIFAGAAAAAGIAPAVFEKDFWVCWILKVLFTLPDPPAGLLFKGGTSLSKVYNAIDRFSEDVDLSFDRSDLGFGGAADPANAPSRKQSESSLDALSSAVLRMVRGPYLEHLQREIAARLGAGRTWRIEASHHPQDATVLHFHYPREYAVAGSGYLSDEVRLEFGARSDHWPAIDASVHPLAADWLPAAFQEPDCRVRVLAGERTFWEKATILHMWHHIPSNREFPSRQSRHYYDVVMLSQHDIGRRAMADPSLLNSVAKHKAVFFRSAWANYQTARPGTLRLVPKPERLRELAADYALMLDSMLFGTPPSFEKLIEHLTATEEQINGAPSEG